MAGPSAEGVVSKGEYAKLKNVSPGRVSQWIAAGQITGAALEGVGRTAKIRIAQADADLSRTLELSQRFGANGVGTVAQVSPAPAAYRPAADPVDDAYKAEKLRQIQFQNRRAEEEAYERQGLYMRTADARAAMAGVAGVMLTTFEGALGDLAKALAAKFELPSRDVLHLLRSEFVDVRARAADAAQKKAEGAPRLVVDEAAGREG